MQLQRIHHVAYRCKDAKQTVEWYGKYLNMKFVLAIAENQVPSTKAPDPYMHVFLDAGADNVLAFFELPNSPDMDRDHNTPAWVQHIAFKVDSIKTLEETKARLQADGIEHARRCFDDPRGRVALAFFQEQSLHHDGAKRREVDDIGVLEAVAEAAACGNQGIGQFERPNANGQVARHQSHTSSAPSKTGPLMHERTRLACSSPCFTGTRVPVRTLVDYIEGGHDLSE